MIEMAIIFRIRFPMLTGPLALLVSRFAGEFVEKLTFIIIIVSLIVSERYKVRKTTAFVD